MTKKLIAGLPSFSQREVNWGKKYKKYKVLILIYYFSYPEFLFVVLVKVCTLKAGERVDRKPGGIRTI